MFRTFRDQNHTQAKAQGYAGLGAVALAQDDNPQALSFATKAEKADPENVYSHVLRGHVWWKDEKRSEAKAAYEMPITKSHGEPWQKAEAFNRLGRIEASQGETDRAIKRYTQALELDSELGAVYANLGYLKSQRRLYADAIAQYQQALQINPNDKTTEALLRIAERWHAFTTDNSRVLPMKRRVKELLAAFQSAKQPGSVNAVWTSAPLSVLLLPLQREGSLAIRAGEKEFIQDRIEHTLKESGRVKLIEPELLARIIHEA